MVNINSVNSIFNKVESMLQELHTAFNNKYHEDIKRGIMRPQIGPMSSEAGTLLTNYKRFKSIDTPANVVKTPTRVAVLLYSHTEHCQLGLKFPNLYAILEESKQELLNLFD